MGKLGKQHRSHVDQDAEGTSFRIRAGFPGCLIEKASGNEVEKLLENDHVRAGGFLVHTPAEW